MAVESPPGQRRQRDAFNEPTTELNVPMGQGVHANERNVLAYVPAAQRAHSSMPSSAWAEPRAQGRHTLPFVAPITFEAVPAAHGRQAEEPSESV